MKASVVSIFSPTYVGIAATGEAGGSDDGEKRRDLVKSYCVGDKNEFEAYNMSIDILSVRIADLIEAGLLSPSAKLHGYHGQNRIDAEVKSDGSFVCGSMISASPSVAAGQAITAILGQRSPGRTYLSINGWHFWRVTHGGQAGKTLADLRRELFESTGQPPA